MGPVGGGGSAVEQARFGKDEGSGANAGNPSRILSRRRNVVPQDG